MKQDNKKKEVNYYIVKSRVNNKLKLESLFYYDLRHYDKNTTKYVIEENVLVNFYGTMITDKPILNGREYIDYKDFFNEFKTIRNNKLNPFRKFLNNRGKNICKV